MRLSALWSNNMVIQRNKPIFINGYTDSSTISIYFANTHYTTTSHNGYFEATLNALPAGGPYDLIIDDGSKTVLSNIWLGDVWILGGQSNMELPVARTLDATAELLENTPIPPHIHLFNVPQVYDFTKEHTTYTSGAWEVIDSENIMTCSAVGYFFATTLKNHHNVPIGLIRTAVGGTPVEAWISDPTLAHLKTFSKERHNLKMPTYVEDTIKKDQERITSWYAEVDANDFGLRNHWMKCQWPEDSYKHVDVPSLWQDTHLEAFKGAIWLQTTITLDETFIQQDAQLTLGAFIDRDDVYVNGTLVGQTGYRYPPRKYTVPAGLLQKGANTITIRLIVEKDAGGSIPGKAYTLSNATGTIDLAGRWKLRIGYHLLPLEPQTFFQYKPSGVYNAMMAPLRNLSIKGILFYQGESNTDHPYNYRKLFTHMIQDWRTLFNQGTLPFIYVQLTGFGNGTTINPGDYWAILRDHQRLCSSLPEVAMIVSIDVGEYNDLHPQNKVAIGERLALAARHLAYKEAITYTGPVLDNIHILSEHLDLCFSNCTNLSTSDSLPLYMTVLWNNGHEEKCLIQLHETVLRLPRKGNLLPLRIRFGWANCPEKPFIYNELGLPASPFEAYLNTQTNSYIF